MNYFDRYKNKQFLYDLNLLGKNPAGMKFNSEDEAQEYLNEVNKKYSDRS